MSEKISKISVDGVVYDIASTGGGEVPGDIQEQLSALENKVTEEASVREEGDAKLSEKIESEASRVDGMVNQINENVASSIETLNNNLVQAIETINGGVAAEVTNREEGDAKLQAAIDELAEKVNGEDADFTELEEKIKKNAADIATVNSNLVEAVDNINKNMVDGFNTINGGIDNEIRPELEKAVKYEDTATEQNPGRKTIFMNNHDNICGYTTDGSAVNIAMVSKWNKVDLGSSSVEINLNGSAERPTYNDSKQIALLEDVHGNMETIALVKKDDLTYELQVGDKIAGTINIPADQFLKSVEYSAEDKSLTFVFNTSEGEQISVVDLSSLVDTYVAGNGIELIGNGFSIKLDPSSESYLSVSEAGIKVEGIDEIKKNVQEVADALGNDPDFAGTVTAELSKKANSADVYTKEEADSKFITEHQSLEDYATKEEVNGVKSSIKVYTSGEGININENDKVSVKISEQERHLNVSPDGSLQFSYSFKKVGPWYYQFLDKNGNQVSNTDTIDFNTEYDSLSNVVSQKAWQVHLDKANATIEALSSTVEILKQKIDSITKTNVQSVVVSGEASDLTDAEKDYIVSGSINKNSTITGKSILLKSIKVSDARLKLNADDVESKDLNISGSFPKADGNTAVSVNNAEFIVFKDMVFNASEIYNDIEIGLAENSVLPKNILFDNCKFQGDFSNNAILVFGTQDNAVITLSNCYFEKISNALRLSNKSNAKGVVVNINNCTVDQWETRAPWQGFLICEDYTSKSEEEANTNNLFGDGKIIVNFNNLIHAGEKVNPTDPASVCGTKNDDQVVFVCRDAVTNPEDSCLSYDQAKFPVVSFK